MNVFLEIILALVVALILIVLFYYYMNWVRDTYTDYDSNKIKELSWYTPPRWIRDAWDPTWGFIHRSYIILQLSI